MGVHLYSLGEFDAARTYLEQAMTLAGPGRTMPSLYRWRGHDGVLSWLWLWPVVLGYPEQALPRSHEALTYAQELAHPFSLTFALRHAGCAPWLRRERLLAQERAEAVLAITTEQGFGSPWGVNSARGWALAAQGQGEAGLAQMHQGLAAIRATGQRLALSHILPCWPRLMGIADRPRKGCACWPRRWCSGSHGERYYEAEVYRLKGELLLRQAVPDHAQAEACFQQALAIARRQQAKSWELRAAMSLAGCGSSRVSVLKPTTCSRRCTAGSPKALTPPTCKTPGRCWRSWREESPCALRPARAWGRLVLPALVASLHSTPHTKGGVRASTLVMRRLLQNLERIGILSQRMAYYPFS